MKKIIFKFSDKSLNNLAKVLNNTPPEKLSLKEVFIKALKQHPSLIMDAINVFK